MNETSARKQRLTKLIPNYHINSLSHMATTEELKLPLCQENIIQPLVSLSSIMDANVLSSITRVFAELSELESNANKLVGFGVLERECLRFYI